MLRSLALAGFLALLLAPAAHAGGFVTVGLGPAPEGVGAGEVWNAEVTVLAHGRTAFTGTRPVVRIDSRSQERRFRATPTGRPGVYRARIVFPAGGSWTVAVTDGFTPTPHRFPTVQVAGPIDPVRSTPAKQAAAPAGTGVATGWLIGGIVAGLLALAVFAMDRRGRRGPRPVDTHELSVRA